MSIFINWYIYPPLNVDILCSEGVEQQEQKKLPTAPRKTVKGYGTAPGLKGQGNRTIAQRTLATEKVWVGNKPTRH